MTPASRELPAVFDPSLKLSPAELELDNRFTEAEREVILELYKNSQPLARYAEEGSTDTEIALIFGVPVKALVPFAALLARSRAELNNRIRRAQLAAADKGSPDALEYLTKKYLSAPKKGAKS